MNVAKNAIPIRNHSSAVKIMMISLPLILCLSPFLWAWKEREKSKKKMITFLCSPLNGVKMVTFVVNGSPAERREREMGRKEE